MNEYQERGRTRKENLSAYEITDALKDCVEEVECEYEIDGVLYDGVVHMSLPKYNFLVSNKRTQVAYVVFFRYIESITFGY